jgi:DNA-binding response OmpR family regulator
LLIDSSPPDLIITDLELPDGDGLDLVRAARTASSISRVIVVSGRSSRGAQEDALAAGASAFVAKPVSADALRSSCSLFSGIHNPTLAAGTAMSHCGSWVSSQVR